MTNCRYKQLYVAFVQGAKWWEYQQTGATMWQSEQDSAWNEAVRLHAAGHLGKTIEEIVKERKP